MGQREGEGGGCAGWGNTWLRIGELGGSLEKITPLNLQREGGIVGEEGEDRRIK